MGTARQLNAKYPTHILDVAYRRRQLEFRRRQISQWLENETELLKMEVEAKGVADKMSDDLIAERLASIEHEAKRQESEALATFGMLVGQDETISPLRRALAVWGLDINDIGVASVSLQCPRIIEALADPSMSSSTARPLLPTTRTKATHTTSNSSTWVAPRATLAPSSLKSGSLGA